MRTLSLTPNVIEKYQNILIKKFDALMDHALDHEFGFFTKNDIVINPFTTVERI